MPAPSAPDHPALRFYGATELSEIVETQREIAKWPAISRASIRNFRRGGAPVPGGLRDPKIFVDPEASAAAIELATPVLHPVVWRFLCDATGTTQAQLQEMVYGYACVRGGKLTQGLEEDG